MKKCLLMVNQIMQTNLTIVLPLDGIPKWGMELVVPM